MPTPLRGRKGIVQLIWVAMLGEVLFETWLDRLSHKALQEPQVLPAAVVVAWVSEGPQRLGPPRTLAGSARKILLEVGGEGLVMFFRRWSRYCCRRDLLPTNFSRSHKAYLEQRL